MLRQMQQFEKALQIFSLKCLGVMKLQNQQFQKKIKQLHDEKNKQFAAKIEPKLDAYIRDGNDETFFDHENVSRK